MVIIGFDPGLTNTGYAVLRKKSNEISLIECGLISPKKSKIISEFKGNKNAKLKSRVQTGCRIKNATCY